MPANDFTVTPYDVEGDIDYEKLLEQFGADELTDRQIGTFPEPVHPLVRRRTFYAQRDLDPFLEAIERDAPHAIVTGRGPSGPMHIGHVVAFYFAKSLQERAGTTVYLPISDDEKFYHKDRSLADISRHTRENLRDILAVGFDPERTRIVVDIADADVVYPIAAAFAEAMTPATVEATYGTPANVGLSFYPAIQATHLLLPQLVDGRQPTLVPIAVDQDPHVRVTRDLAGKQRFDVNKPGALLSKFLPSLEGPGKMSSSAEAPSIRLDDDRETVHEKIQQHAYSGGQSSIEAHRRDGGNPAVDVAYQYLRAVFEDDDDRLANLAQSYREGELLSGELKAIAADAIADFLEDHQRRRAALGDLEDELAPFRVKPDEKRRARRAIGYPDDALVQSS